MSKTLNTKFGKAKANKDGHYVIISRTEGNKNKYLHRLIWEDFYGKKIPKGYVIHHLNHHKDDNRIQNLQCCDKRNHSRFHGKNLSDESRNKIREANVGKTIPHETRLKISEANKGKKRSDETRQKMRENHSKYWEGKKFDETHRLKMSKSHNSSGYFRVHKQLNKKCKQGFTWIYRYYEDGKQNSISSVDIERLEAKVRAKGLKWLKFEKED